jgi:hypothetical protein
MGSYNRRWDILTCNGFYLGLKVGILLFLSNKCLGSLCHVNLQL